MGEPAEAVTVGVGVTVTVTVWAGLVQPAVVPVTVYVVVEPGVTLTVDVFTPMPGDQLYVVAPLADITVEFPEHIVVDPDAVIVGEGFTVTTIVCCALVQPLVVPVTE